MLYFIHQMLETEYTRFLVNKQLRGTYSVIVLLGGAGWIFTRDAQSMASSSYWNTATPTPFVASVAVFKLQGAGGRGRLTSCRKTLGLTSLTYLASGPLKKKKKG